MLRWFVRKVVEYVLEELDAKGRLTVGVKPGLQSSASASENDDERQKRISYKALADSIVQHQAPVQMSAIGETSKVIADKKHGDRTVDRLAGL